MVEYPIYYSLGSQWRSIMVKQVAQQLGVERKVSDEEFQDTIFPEIASGGTISKQFSEGVSLRLWDIVVAQPVIFRGISWPTNEFYYLLCDLSEEKSHHKQWFSSVEGKVNKGTGAISYPVVFSSGDKVCDYIPATGVRFRGMLCIFSKNWFLNILDQSPLSSIDNPFSVFLGENSLFKQFPLQPDLKQAIERLFKQWNRKGSPSYLDNFFYRQALLNVFYVFLKQYVRDWELNSGVDQAIKLRFDQLRESIEKDDSFEYPSTSQAAQRCLVTKNKFIIYFKTFYNTTYSMFCQQDKMKKAAAMLQKGIPVLEVGLTVGFSNISHFARMFKRTYGVLPKQYQQGMKNNMP